MDSDSSDDYLAKKKKQRHMKISCPNIETVHRHLLDFDFEKVCSVSLSHSNVYGCLVCAKYFQGRGKDTPAYIHSMEHEHHLFINLLDGKIWCVPDNYEVVDSGLDDIKFNLNPKFTKKDIESLPSSSLSLSGSEYLPGVVGLNQIKDDSYFNAVVHALCAVAPLRDMFLVMEKSQTNTVASSYSDLVKKMTNPQSFKGIVSPHEFLQTVSSESGSEFFTSHADPFKFLLWLLPSLQGDSSRISQLFQGTSSSGPFLTISFDLPLMPVFKDDSEIIPTVAIGDLLDKKFESDPLVKAPKYLVLHFNRFVKNNFFLEKNSTIVRCPVKGLRVGNSGTYSLVATVTHEGKPVGGFFKTYVLHPVSQQWCECSGLKVTRALPQSVSVVESYIQIWRADNQ